MSELGLKICVALCTFNGAKFIEQQLESISVSRLFVVGVVDVCKHAINTLDRIERGVQANLQSFVVIDKRIVRMPRGTLLRGLTWIVFGVDTPGAKAATIVNAAVHNAGRLLRAAVLLEKGAPERDKISDLKGCSSRQTYRRVAEVNYRAAHGLQGAPALFQADLHRWRLVSRLP